MFPNGIKRAVTLFQRFSQRNCKSCQLFLKVQHPCKFMHIDLLLNPISVINFTHLNFYRNVYFSRYISYSNLNFSVYFYENTLFLFVAVYHIAFSKRKQGNLSSLILCENIQRYDDGLQREVYILGQLFSIYANEKFC